MWAANRINQGLELAQIAATMVSNWNFLSQEAANSIVDAAQGWVDSGKTVQSELEKSWEVDYDASLLLPPDATEALVVYSITDANGAVVYKSARVLLTAGMDVDQLADKIEEIGERYMSDSVQDSTIFTAEVKYVR
jgi:hypothetical protein